MTSNLSKKLELAANIAIVVVALLIGFVVVQKYFFAPDTEGPPKEVARGTKMTVPETDFQANGKTLLVVLQKGCKYCAESMTFYKTLVQQAPEKGVKVVAVLPGAREESAAYLNEYGVALPEVRQASLNSVNVRGTPTLILVNDKGEVSNSWVGKLPPEREKEVLGQL